MVERLWKSIAVVEKCRKSVAANTQRKALKILVVSIVSIVERKYIYYMRMAAENKNAPRFTAQYVRK